MTLYEEMTIVEYIKHLEETEIKPSTTPLTVRDWNKRFSDKQIIANHEYQREEGAWKMRLQKGLIFTLLARRPVPPILTVYNQETGQTEIVDGQHRLIAIRDFHNGKVPLPRFVPEKFGGGKTIQNIPPEIVDRIDGAIITEMTLLSNTGKLMTNDIKDIYSSLQKSALLTLGQEVRAKHGEYRDLIDDLAENPLCSKFGQKADKELQFAAYIVAYAYQVLHGRIPWFKKPNVIELLEDIEGEPCDDNVRVLCFQLLDALGTVVSDIKLSNFYGVSVVCAIGELIRRDVPLEEVKLELSPCFRKFWGLLQKIKFEDTSLDYNNKYVLRVRDILKSGASVDHSKKLFEVSDLILEVWENEGELPM